MQYFHWFKNVESWEYIIQNHRGVLCVLEHKGTLVPQFMLQNIVTNSRINREDYLSVVLFVTKSYSPQVVFRDTFG